MNKGILIILLATILTLTACTPCLPCETPTPMPEPTATATPETSGPEYWDSRLDDLNVTIIEQGRYELIAAWLTINGNWDDVPAWAHQWQEDTLGGDTHAYGICYDIDGNILYGKTFALGWPGGAAGSTPEPDGWANAFLGGGGSTYYPDQGQSGPFDWGPLNSDKLNGLGLPYNLHYSFFGAWVARW